MGQVSDGLAFIHSNSEIMSKVLAFAACSAMGQSFIFFVIAEYGALKCATVTTTRKIFSVLLSILIKGHSLNAVGWLGVVLGSLGIAGELLPEKKAEVRSLPMGGTSVPESAAYPLAVNH